MRPATPNHALKPTAPAVTACAADRRHLSTHRHRPRQPPPWLSLGSISETNMRNISTSLTRILITAAFMLVSPSLHAAKFTGESDIQAEPLSPEESMGRMRVEEGLRVELVAAEPLIRDPADVAFDEAGRMFVAEIAGYNQAEGARPRSRIRLLEDSDGDGRMDKSTIFADDLDLAQGLLPTRGGLIVTTNTGILFLRDDDGDGRADFQEVLFTCTPAIHVDAQMSAPRRGIDNWIHVNLGLQKKELARPTAPERKLSLTTNFRFRQGTDEFGASEGAGQFGKAFDDWDREFFSQNRNPGMVAVLPQRYLERNPFAFLTRSHEDAVPAEGEGKVYPLKTFRTTSSAHAGTFTAACGTGVYRGDLLGREVAGSLFVCEPTGALVSRWIVEPFGPSFRAHRAQPEREFLASSDEWFRPVNTTIGPDGALYIVDMYRRFIDGARFFPDDYRAKNDMAAGADRGRIYRIMPKDAGKPRVTAMPREPEKRVALLEHPNGWQRDTAQRLLVEAGDASVLPAVEKILRGSSFAQARLHALWTIEGLGKLTPAHVAAALDDAEPGVVENALWLAPRFVRTSDAIRERVIKLASNENARLRFAALLAVGDLESADATKSLVQAAVHDAEDTWMRTAILSAPATQSGEFLAALLREPTFISTGTRGHIELANGLAMILAARGKAAELKPVLAVFDAEGNWWKMAVVRGIAEGLRRQAANALPKTISALLAAPPPELAGSLSGLEKAVASAAAIVSDRSRPVSERLAAIPLIEHLPKADVAALIAPLLSSREPIEIQQATLETLTHLKRPIVTPILYAHLSEMGTAARSGAMQYLQRNPAELLQKIKAGVLNPALVDSLGRWLILNSAVEEVRTLGQEIFGKMEGDRKALVQRYATATASLQGSEARGHETFTQTCTVCHRFRGEGNDVGPDISDVRIKTPEMLLSDILDPNNAIDPQWEAYTVRVKDGRALVGRMASETNDAIVIKGPTGSETVPRASLVTAEPLGMSLMPQGLEAAIDEHRMADLLAYLRSEPAAASATQEPVIVPRETISLFNGKDFSSFYTWLAKFRYEDADRVFTVVESIDGAPAIRISGQHYGGIITRSNYANYKLVAEFRWGSLTWRPRVGKSRDAGILLHCQGEDGNHVKTFDSQWPRSVEFQIIEGGTGDILLVNGYDRGVAEPIAPRLTVAVQPGKTIWDPHGTPTEFSTGRLDWQHRDLGWKDALGFRGSQDVENPTGDWNRIEAICEGGNVTYFLNGTKVNEGTNGTFREGKILFQSEGAEIFFRHIELQPLPATAKPVGN